MELLFLEAKPIPSHAITALLAVIIGGIQLASAKGTRQHQLLGYLWVSMMMYVSISIFYLGDSVVGRLQSNPSLLSYPDGFHAAPVST